MDKFNPKYLSLVNNIAAYSGSTTIAQFIMMVYVVLLARILGPEELGVFSSAYALVGLTAFFLNLGMDTWLLRKAGMYPDVRRLSGKILKIKAGIGIWWSIALVVVVPVIRPDLFSISMMVICSLDVWSDVCFNTQIQGLNVQRRMKTIGWLMLLSRGGRITGLAIIYFLGFDSAFFFALSRATATFIGLLAVTWLHRPKLNSQGFMTTRDVINESLPYGVSDFLALIYTNADVTILALMAGTIAVGLYSPASGIIHALFVIPSALFTVIVPILTNVGVRDVSRFRKALPILFASFFIMGLILWLVLGFSAKWLMPFLLGEEYQFTGEILGVLSPIIFFKFISFACAVVLVCVGWQQRRLIYQLIVAVFNIGANILVIPLYGITGVAWVYVISELLLVIGYGWVTIKWIRYGIFEGVSLQDPHDDVL